MQSISKCESEARGDHSVVVDMDGALLIDPNSFPYLALVAFDVGGILRLLLLLLVAPLSWFLHRFVSESAGIRVLIFVSFVGVRVSSIQSAVLPKYYSQELHPETWRVLSSCGRKCVVTGQPRIMVDPFLKNYLGVDLVVGTEICTCAGIATGFVASSGVVAGAEKVMAVNK